MQSDKKFVEYITKEIKSKDIDPTNLGVIYEYLGDREKALGIFKSLTDYEMPSSVNIKGLTEKAKKDARFLIGIGKHQLDMAVENDLALRGPERSKQFFVWASEYCSIPENVFQEWVRIKQFDEIAVGYLWRGYALLMLGGYEESCSLLRQVPVYFNKEKLTGGEVWQVFEPKLVKALLPLCEYELYPSEDNRVKARQGLDDYIRSFREPKFKLEGYLYYFHLKEMFPEVYSENTARSPADEAQNGIRGADNEEFKTAPGNVDLRGAVIVSDVDRCYLDVFGTNKDLVEYVDKVKAMGGFPLLSGLMDVYAVEDTAGDEASQLIEECNRLLKTVQDPWLLEKTRAILEVATKAQEDESGVILYYDPDLDLSKF